MKYRSLGPLILCGFFFLAPVAFSQKPTDSSTNLKLARVSQNELNQVAEKLVATEMQQYTYRLHKFDAKRVVKLDKQKSVRGLFLMRKPEFMKPLSNGFYDDLQGDLIYFGHFQNTKKQDTSYSLTLGLGGEAIVALDFNNDGTVDGMIGRKINGDLWELRNELWRSFWRCIDSHREESLMAAVGLCGVDGGSSGSGRLGSSSDSERSDLEDFVDALSTPDCDTVNPRENVSDSDERIRLGLLEAVATEEAKREAAAAESSRGEDRARHERAASAFREAATHLRASREADARADRATNPADRAAAERLHISERDAALKALDRARPGTAERLRQRLSSPPSRPRPGSGAHITPGPSEGEDPRCGGIRTQIKQGLLFRNRQFCGDDDPITCWERANDAIRDFTHGACHTETGPDDASRIVCEKTEDPLGEPTPDPVPGPADGPAHPVNIPPGQRLNYSFVGTTPLGAVLAILCQADGGSCGRWEGLKLAKPKP